MSKYLPDGTIAERVFTKELVLRLYGTELTKLKAAMREVASLPGLEPMLYEKDNEYLIRLLVKSGGAAASDQLCESAAQLLCERLEEDVYGRGEETLAKVAAGGLLKCSGRLATVNKELGVALEQEFSLSKRGAKVLADGGKTYMRPSHFAPNQKTVLCYGEASVQCGAELAFAAMKAGKAKYGAAVTKMDANGRRWAVVTHIKRVFVRQLPVNASNRACALAVLDLVRRLTEKGNLQAGDNCYKKGKINTDKPINLKKSHKPIWVAAFILAVAVLLAMACYYYFNIYAPLPSSEAMQVQIGN